MMVSIDNESNNSYSRMHSPSATSDFIIDSKEESMDATSLENGGNDDDRNCISLESADYQGSLDASDHMGKRYFCQRCLNHGLEFQRKGHKPSCKYAACTCELCMMVEQRRQINYQLSMWKPDDDACIDIINGRKIRNPKCARCSAHGKKQALRGHKKVSCPFNNCQCDMCALVENRRVLMARQIRVRRTQQRQRQHLPSETTPEPTEDNASSDATILKPLPRVLKPNNTLISLLNPRPTIKKQAKSILLGHAKQSAFVPTLASTTTMPPQQQISLLLNAPSTRKLPSNSPSTGKVSSLPNAPSTRKLPNLLNNPSTGKVSLPNGPSSGISTSTASSTTAMPFSPAQMEFLMKLFMQASQQQQQQQQQQQPSSHFAHPNVMNPFMINPQQSNILPTTPFGNGNTASLFSSPHHHPFTGFPFSSSSLSSTAMSNMAVNPFLFSCFQGFPSQFSFQPFLTERRPS